MVRVRRENGWTDEHSRPTPKGEAFQDCLECHANVENVGSIFWTSGSQYFIHEQYGLLERSHLGHPGNVELIQRKSRLHKSVQCKLDKLHELDLFRI